jgi:hypothetical protein
MTTHNKAKHRREFLALKRAAKQVIRDLPQGHGAAFAFADAPWKDDDRVWFAEHPTRSFRLRRLHPGEFPAEILGNATHVTVRQLSPGFRDKHLAGDARGGTDLDALPDSDAIAMALRDEFAKAAASGQPFPLQRAVDRAALMVHAAGKGGVQ